ncbi:MAG: protein kinase [Planctomycetes bacterium]|nr:protein kinase [Planctomycetota bacterium]
MTRQAENPPSVVNALLRFLADGADQDGAPPALELCLARFAGYEELVVRTYHELVERPNIDPSAGSSTSPEPTHGENEASAELLAADALAASVFEDVGTSALVPGGRLGPYRLERELGRGAQGWVWLAEDTRLGRLVALKTFHGGSLADPAALRRFEREARIVSRLDHPGICGLYEAGTLEGIPFIAVRYVEGRSLASTLVGGPGDRAWQRLWAQRIAQMARALHAAHEAGVVHRDVKPSNVVLDAEERPVLLDFGLAQAQLEPGLTLEGNLFGTPPYMAPEQCRGELDLDRRVDVYALGVILHQALAGVAPFNSATPRSMIEATLRSEVPDLRLVRPRIPHDLVVIANTAMARNLNDRYASAAALAEDLENWRNGAPIAARPLGPLVRLGRWTQRRPALALALLAFSTSTSVGILVSLRALQRAQLAVEGQARSLEAEREARRASERSLRERDVALRSQNSLRLAAESVSQRDVDPTKSLQLALLAQESAPDPVPEVASALQEALNGWRELAVRELSSSRIIDLLFRSAEELLCLDGQGALHRWSWCAGALEPVAEPPLSAIAAHAARKLLVGGTKDGRLRWLDERCALLREQLLEDGAELVALEFDPQGERLFALDEQRRLSCFQSSDGTILWKRAIRARGVPEGSEPRPMIRRAEQRSDPDGLPPPLRTRISFSPSGAVIVLSDTRIATVCLRAADGEELAFDPAPRAVALSDQELFTAQGSPMLRVREIESGATIAGLPRTRIDRPLTELTLSRSTLVLASNSGYVEFWHRDAIAPYAGVHVGETTIRRLAVDERGAVLATGCDDGTVHVYDLAARASRCSVGIDRIPRRVQVEPCSFLADGAALWHLAPDSRAILHDPSGGRATKTIQDTAFSGAHGLACSSDDALLGLLYSTSAAPRSRDRASSMRLRIFATATGERLADHAVDHDAKTRMARAGGGWLVIGPQCAEHRSTLGEVERTWSRVGGRRGPNAILGEQVSGDAQGRRLFMCSFGRPVEELLLPDGQPVAVTRELPGARQLSWVHPESGAALSLQEQRICLLEGAGNRQVLLELAPEERVLECAWLSERIVLVWTQPGERSDSSSLRCLELSGRELWTVALEGFKGSSRSRGSRLLTLEPGRASTASMTPLVVLAPDHLERRDARTGALIWKLPPASDPAGRVALDPTGSWLGVINLRAQSLELIAVDPERTARRWLARVGR